MSNEMKNTVVKEFHVQMKLTRKNRIRLYLWHVEETELYSIN